MEVELGITPEWHISDFQSSISRLSLPKKIDAITENLDSKAPLELIPRLSALIQCLKERNGIREFVAADCVYKLLVLYHNLHNHNEMAVRLVMTILCRIAYGSTTDKEYLRKQGALDTFRSALEHDSEFVCQQACMALEYYCHESVTLRNEIVELEVVPVLIECSQKRFKIGPLRSVLSLMKVICRGPTFPDADTTIGFLPIWTSSLAHVDEQIRLLAISGIASIAHYSTDHEEMSNQIPSIIHQLVSILASEGKATPKTTTPILEAFLVLIRSSELAIAAASQSSLIMIVERYINHEKLAVRHPATKLAQLLVGRAKK